MKLKDRDFEETKELADIIRTIDHLNRQEAEVISDRIYRNQPFIISLLLGYRYDVDARQLEGITKVLSMIYLFFEQKTEVERYQITEQDFIDAEDKNINFFTYFDTETTETQHSLTEMDLEGIRFKSLFSAVMHTVLEESYFEKMDFNTKGTIIIGMKSLIECMEAKLL